MIRPDGVPISTIFHPRTRDGSDLICNSPWSLKGVNQTIPGTDVKKTAQVVFY
jgi:hypothetical protein